MLDRDLAALYGVTTFNLNKAVKRNADRFPEDFMFQLTAEEAGTLRFQIGMSKANQALSLIAAFTTVSNCRSLGSFPLNCFGNFSVR
jgi:hypothetical protein